MYRKLEGVDSFSNEEYNRILLELQGKYTNKKLGPAATVDNTKMMLFILVTLYEFKSSVNCVNYSVPCCHIIW